MKGLRSSYALFTSFLVLLGRQSEWTSPSSISWALLCRAEECYHVPNSSVKEGDLSDLAPKIQ